MRIDVPLVRRLIDDQFPEWRGLTLRPVLPGGWDNRTFRLGEDLSVRLPSAAWYAGQVEKEHRWLPILASAAPLRIQIPEPLAMGRPGHGYPWLWSVRRWIDGASIAESATSFDDLALAGELADFLKVLWTIHPGDGPSPGRHNFFRGGDLAVYDHETRAAVTQLGDALDRQAAVAAWESALESRWTATPVWVHGDMSAGNLLVRDGRLVAVIDFGCMAVGDPACDLVPAWTLLSGTGRAQFRDALEIDDDTWRRARAWALWKALITLADPERTPAWQDARRVLGEVLGGARDQPFSAPETLPC